MAIFSLGGLQLATHTRPQAVRCQPGFIPMDEGRPPQVILDPFPEKGMRGVLEDGWARLFRGDEEVGSQPLGTASIGGGRWWTDLDLLVFAGTTLWTWIGLPLALDRPEVVVGERAPGVLDVAVPADWPATSTRHVLHLGAQGQVVRHWEGRYEHELREHCEFGGAVVATRRRTRALRGVTVLWADVVAAAMHGKPLN